MKWSQIICALAGSVVFIAFFFMTSIRPRGRREPRGNRTRYDVQTLVNALKVYEATYGKLPGDQGTDARIGPKCPTKYDTLIESLSCSDANNDGEITGSDRGVRMVESDWPKGGTLTDHWKKRFAVYLDLDYNEVGIMRCEAGA